MNYINFVVITDTPVRLRNFLVNRGVIKAVTNPMDGSTNYVGVRPGMEWVKVPNPIQIDPGDPNASPPVPPTYDDRSVYLVKFAHESVDNEFADNPNEGESPAPEGVERLVRWTKFGRWIQANSTVVTAPENYLINGEPAGDAYKINGEQVWLVRDAPERFGVWQ